MISAVETRKQRDLGAEEQAGQTATRLGEAEASLALKEKELMALREAGDAAKAARDAAQGELAKLKAVVDAQTAAAEQRQAAALRETEVHESLLAEVEALRVEVKVKERAVNSALLQSAERGSTADAAQVAAETATAELEKLRRVVAEKATAAPPAAMPSSSALPLPPSARPRAPRASSLRPHAPQQPLPPPATAQHCPRRVPCSVQPARRLFPTRTFQNCMRK